MDDLDARAAARQLGLTVIGTIGLLERAAELNLLDLPSIIDQLKQTNFFVSNEILDGAIERDRKRKAGL